MNLKMRIMKVIKEGLYLTQKELLYILTSRGLNKMVDFHQGDGQRGDRVDAGCHSEHSKICSRVSRGG